MSSYEQINNELEVMKARFMRLNTDEEREAFRTEVKGFADSKNEADQKILGEVFIAGAEKACIRAEAVIDGVLRAQLEGIYESVSWSYIARAYFSKSRAWLSQRINGFIVHGKEAGFTIEEKKTLLGALRDLSGRIERTAQVIEQTL